MKADLCGLLTQSGIIPLTGVNVSAVLIGRGAKVKVVQEFKNNEEKPLEAVYKFPLPEGAAIFGFKAIVGERTITGYVEERDKAFEDYDDALMGGHGAYLLDEERPNIFSLSLGNLNPGASVQIEIEYVTLLETQDDEIRFFLPTTISPRYIPDDFSDDDGIPTDEKINPDFSLDVPYGLSISIDVINPEKIESIESPSHKIAVNLRDSFIRVEFSSKTAKMDRDFVLNIRRKKRFESRAYLYSDTDADFIQIDFTNHDENLPTPLPQKDIVFVLDCSGSMNGSSIIQAKRALEIFLKGLEEGINFNIYRFGSTFDKLFVEGVPYSNDSLEKALEYISKTDADLGGTEILTPLQDICAGNKENRTDIILVTDGEVGNESEIIELARKNRQKVRIFTVGIGYGPNEYFIKQTARVSGASSELVAPGERIETKILRLFDKVKSISINDIKISLNKEVEQAPEQSSVFQHDTITIFGKTQKINNQIKEIKVKSALGDNSVEWSIPLQKIGQEGGFIPKLWAKEMINDKDFKPARTSQGSLQELRKQQLIKNKCIEIAKRYGISSKLTSFVAVEERIDAEKTKDESILRKVPVMLTKDWGGRKDKVISAVYNLSFTPSRLEYRSINHFICDDSCSYSRRLSCKSERRLNLDELTTNDDIVMKILCLQQPDGGFILDEEAFMMLGFYLPDLSFSTLKSLSEQIQTVKEADRFKLLCTAIVLVVLDKKFGDMKKHFWGSVVEKSRKWLKKQIDKTNPLILGEELMQWAERTVQD